MTVTLPAAKLQEVLDLVTAWTSRQSATLHELQVLMGKLLYVVQVCSPAHLFLNRMLETLRLCFPSGPTPLSPVFHKDLRCFHRFLPSTDSIFIIHEDGHPPVPLHIDACTTGCGGCTDSDVYHSMFPLTHPLF